MKLRSYSLPPLTLAGRIVTHGGHDGDWKERRDMWRQKSKFWQILYQLYFFYTQTIIIIQTVRLSNHALWHDVGLRKEPNGENMKLCKQGDEFHLDEHYGLRKWRSRRYILMAEVVQTTRFHETIWRHHSSISCTEICTGCILNRFLATTNTVSCEPRRRGMERTPWQPLLSVVANRCVWQPFSLTTGLKKLERLTLFPGLRIVDFLFTYCLPPFVLLYLLQHRRDTNRKMLCGTEERVKIDLCSYHSFRLNYFPILFSRMQGYTLKLGHGRFLPNAFELFIRLSPFYSTLAYIVCVTKKYR
jgi:hypothetical protein